MKPTWLVGAWWIRPIRSASELLWNADKPMAELRGELGQPLVDLLERDLAIDAGLAQAEQVQVGTVEQENMRHGRPRHAANVAGSLSGLSLKGDSLMR